MNHSIQEGTREDAEQFAKTVYLFIVNNKMIPKPNLFYGFDRMIKQKKDKRRVYPSKSISNEEFDFSHIHNY